MNGALLRVAGIATVLATIHLPVARTRMSYCIVAVGEVAQIVPILWCREIVARLDMHFVITVRLRLFVDVVLCH